MGMFYFQENVMATKTKSPGIPLSPEEKEKRLTLRKAAICYLDRQSRDEHPDGHFDNKKRWEPSSIEHCECCDSIRTPSKAWPFSLMVHCRTAQHIARLYGVPSRELLAAARKIEAKRAAR
jgi:hypothetical protein